MAQTYQSCSNVIGNSDINIVLGKGDGEGNIKKTSRIGGHEVVNL